MSKKPERLGDAPIDEKYRQKMQSVALTIDQFFNGELRGKDRKVGFVMMVFEFGEHDFKDRCNYISNGADRKDVVTLMKEMIRRFEGQPEMKGNA